MKNFDWEEFKEGGIAVHCIKDEEVEDFLEECKRNNIEVDKSSIKEDREGFHYLNCYDFDDEELDSSYFDYYSTKNYKIIEWEIDEIKEEKKVYKIQDLFKDEFVGKDFLEVNLDRIFTVTEYGGCPCVEDLFGKLIEDSYDMIKIFNMEFELVEEEIKPEETKLKGYLANGLFGLGDRLVNELLAKEIREAINIDLYNPQENMAINDKQAYADSKQIYEGDYDYLKETDFLVAIIDGCEIDGGTAAEIGIVSTMNKPIYALYTDTRQQGTENQRKVEALVNDSTENQFMYRNLFVVGLIKKHGYIFNNIEDLVKQLKEDIDNKNIKMKEGE